MPRVSLPQTKWWCFFKRLLRHPSSNFLFVPSRLVSLWVSHFIILICEIMSSTLMKVLFSTEEYALVLATHFFFFYCIFADGTLQKHSWRLNIRGHWLEDNLFWKNPTFLVSPPPKADKAEVTRIMELGRGGDKRESNNLFGKRFQIGLRRTQASFPGSSPCSPQPESSEITIKNLTDFSVLLLPNLALPILLGLNKKQSPPLFSSVLLLFAYKWLI